MTEKELPASVEFARKEVSGAELQDTIVQHIDRLIAKGKQIKPVGHAPLDGYRGATREVFSPNDYPEWKTQVDAFLINFVGEQSPYYKNFRTYEEAHAGRVPAMLGVLKAIREDYQNGVAHGLKYFVVAETLVTFLETSKRFVKEGRNDAAAILLGCILEAGLRVICQKRCVATDETDKLTTLKDKLSDARVLSPIQGKWVETAIKLRHYAVHREHDKYSNGDVEEMQKRVTDILAYAL